MIYGMNVHQAGESALRLAASLGITMIRVDANWYDLEPVQGVYIWEWLDRLITTAHQFGLDVLPTVSYSPPWLGPRHRVPPIDDWRRFLTAFGERYVRQVRHVELWNEPNQPGLFDGRVEDYINIILQPGAETLRAIDPDFRICGPALSTEGSWPAWLQTCVSRGQSWLDVCTVHSYQPSGRDVAYALDGWHWPWDAPSVRQVLKRAGAPDLPLWLTEFGWNTARITYEQQASHYDQFFEVAHDVIGLEAAFGFNLIDEPGGDVRWGVFRQDGTLKPAARVIQARASGGSPREAVLAAYHDYQPGETLDMAPWAVLLGQVFIQALMKVFTDLLQESQRQGVMSTSITEDDLRARLKAALDDALSP